MATRKEAERQNKILQRLLADGKTQGSVPIETLLKATGISISTLRSRIFKANIGQGPTSHSRLKYSAKEACVFVRPDATIDFGGDSDVKRGHIPYRPTR